MTTGTSTQRASTVDDFLPVPGRWCDLIMKGGVTSGVVYPRAVSTLARTYRFKNIGGTSAGAIAASAAAAAEYGRQHPGCGKHFPDIDALPDFLKEHNRVFRLFQPQRKTRPLFEILAAVTDSRRGPLAAVWPAIWGFKLWFVPGLVVGIITAIFCLRFLASPGLLAAVLAGPPAATRLFAGDVAGLVALATGFIAVVAAALALIIAVLTLFGFPAAAVAIGMVLRTLTVLPANYYGICTGFRNQDDPAPAPVDGDKALEPLTQWLMLLLDRVAGVDKDVQPLTFGDLWGLDRKQRANPEWQKRAIELRERVELREINLELVTTCISQGRPYKFPLDLSTFYFHTDTMRQLFPTRVVDWMIDHERDQTGGPDDADACAQRAGYRRLPNPEDLPVIVAARMSLSVPPLISAVPLYAFDLSLRAGDVLPPIEKCWFSDGGITSNFPMHFFDSPLPRWPTFGINLRPEQPNHPIVDGDQCKNVHMPRSDDDGIDLPWPARWHDLGGFANAIVRTMQNWNDDMQLMQPGFRDRIAHVNLADNEGGFNLSMPSCIVQTLGERGRCAGEKLVENFTAPADAPDIKLTWANHRWTRYRATMANLAEYLTAFQRGYFDKEIDRRGGAASYAELIDRQLDDPPSGCPWTEPLRDFAKGETFKVADTGETWTKAKISFDDDNPPQPRGQVRSVPRI